jgi:hypothetical protein
VHGLYTVKDAIEDYQGSIIEPIFHEHRSAYRDSDEMAAALASQDPHLVLLPDRESFHHTTRMTLALLEGYGYGETSCCSTSSGMAAIMTAVQPFLKVQNDLHETGTSWPPSSVMAGLTSSSEALHAGAQHRMPLGSGCHQPDEWASKSINIPASLWGAPQQSAAGIFRHQVGGGPGT